MIKLHFIGLPHTKDKEENYHKFRRKNKQKTKQTKTKTKRYQLVPENYKFYINKGRSTMLASINM